MKVIYAYKENKQPIYIKDSKGVQRVLVVFTDSSDTYVYYVDDYLRNTYLNKIIDTKAVNVFDILNFTKIESDEQFYSYQSWITRNFNYDGKHVNEVITGHDQGGAILVDMLGNKLL